MEHTIYLINTCGLIRDTESNIYLFSLIVICLYYQTWMP